MLDLPGTYSLSPQSLDEQISRDVLLNRLPELPAPSAIVVVVDASNLQRNLYYATQVIELGYPTLIALNMIDVAEENGHQIDAGKLAAELGVPVLPLVASTGQGVAELRQAILASLQAPPRSKPRQFSELPAPLKAEADAIAELLAKTFHERRAQAAAEALLILSNEKALASSLQHYPAPIQDAVSAARRRLDAAGIDWRGVTIEGRYLGVAAIQRAVTTELTPPGETFSDKLDRVLTHKAWGTIIFLAIMTLMFQSIFTFARIPMDALQTGVDWLGHAVGGLIPPGRFEQPARGWGDCGRGRGGRLSPANPAAVSLHRLSRGHRLHGPRRFPHGPPDEQGRACTARVLSRCSAPSPARSPASWPRAPSRAPRTAW